MFLNTVSFLMRITVNLWLIVSAAKVNYQKIRASQVIDPRDSRACSPLEGLDYKRSLVIMLPQLGEFDSSEFIEQIVAVEKYIIDANLNLRVIGIGNTASALRFSRFTGLSLDCLRVDPDAKVHEILGLHRGPRWSIPDFISETILSSILKTLPGSSPKDENLIRQTANAWLNYLAMCAGVSAPGLFVICILFK